MHGKTLYELIETPLGTEQQFVKRSTPQSL